VDRGCEVMDDKRDFTITAFIEKSKKYTPSLKEIKL